MRKKNPCSPSTESKAIPRSPRIARIRMPIKDRAFILRKVRNGSCFIARELIKKFNTKLETSRTAAKAIDLR